MADPHAEFPASTTASVETSILTIACAPMTWLGPSRAPRGTKTPAGTQPMRMIWIAGLSDENLSSAECGYPLDRDAS